MTEAPALMKSCEAVRLVTLLRFSEAIALASHLKFGLSIMFTLPENSNPWFLIEPTLAS